MTTLTTIVQTATTHTIELLAVDRGMVTVRVASGGPQRISWDTLREAARQDDQTLAAPYRELLSRAKAMLASQDAVDDARRTIGATDPWWPINVSEVPADIRFDTLRQDQGQMIEVSYGTRGAAEAGTDAEYRRVVDHSDRTCMHYRRRAV